MIISGRVNSEVKMSLNNFGNLRVASLRLIRLSGRILVNARVAGTTDSLEIKSKLDIERVQI